MFSPRDTDSYISSSSGTVRITGTSDKLFPAVVTAVVSTVTAAVVAAAVVASPAFTSSGSDAVMVTSPVSPSEVFSVIVFFDDSASGTDLPFGISSSSASGLWLFSAADVRNACPTFPVAIVEVLIKALSTPAIIRLYIAIHSFYHFIV